MEARNVGRTSETRETRDAGEATATGSAKVGSGVINAERVAKETSDKEKKMGSKEARDIAEKRTKLDAVKGIHSLEQEKDITTSDDDDYIELTAGQPIASVVPDIARIDPYIISSDEDFVAPSQRKA